MSRSKAAKPVEPAPEPQVEQNPAIPALVESNQHHGQVANLVVDAIELLDAGKVASAAVKLGVLSAHAQQGLQVTANAARTLQAPS